MIFPVATVTIAVKGGLLAIQAVSVQVADLSR